MGRRERSIKRQSREIGRLDYIIAFCIGMCAAPTDAEAKPPRSPKSKFYDFSDQLIDGQIKKPTALYTDARNKVKFDRLGKVSNLDRISKLASTIFFLWGFSRVITNI